MLFRSIVSDGGCTTPGDVAKAFGGGADFVMLGGMLAGHEESGGRIVADYGSAVDACVREGITIYPDIEKTKIYRAKYENYRRIIEAMDRVWATL